VRPDAALLEPLPISRKSRVNRFDTPDSHGFEGSFTMMSYVPSFAR
jgi:hypothetical protein